MENEPSPLATLRQLKEWLDAGAITPAEFEVLKRKLLFSDTSSAPAASPEPPVAPTAPDAPAASVPPPAPVVPAPAPLPPPPPSWDFKHDPTIPAGATKPVEEPVNPFGASTPPPTETPPPRVTAPPVMPPPAGPVPPMASAREQTPGPPKKPAPPIDSFTKPVEMVKVGSSSYRDADSLAPAEPRVPESRHARPGVPPPAATRSPLTTILIIGGILALLALIFYLMTDNRDSERLTSLSRAGADTVRTEPEVGPQAERIELPPVADTDTDTARVTPALPATPTPATPDTTRARAAAPPVAPAPVPATQPEPAPATPPATAPGNNSRPDSVTTRTPTPAATPAPASPPANAKVGAVEARVRNALSAYYEDLKAPPFNAAQHFAPTVERFYTLQNTTPEAISAELARSHFPEFLEGETQGVPGSLTISEPVQDGSRVVTFLEKSRAFRKSRQQYQNTTAQVRIRFDRNFKIMYLRQERLLENSFSE